MCRPAKVITGAGILLGIMMMVNVSPATASDRFDVRITVEGRFAKGSSFYTIIPGQPRKSVRFQSASRRAIYYGNIKEPESDYIVVSLLSPGGNETGQSFQGIFEEADDADGNTVSRHAVLRTRNASTRVVVRVIEVD